MSTFQKSILNMLEVEIQLKKILQFLEMVFD